jgi:hypothetical protein
MTNPEKASSGNEPPAERRSNKWVLWLEIIGFTLLIGVIVAVNR